MMKWLMVDVDDLQSSPSGGVHQRDRRVPVVWTFVCKDGQIEVDPMWRFQLLELAEQPSDVFISPRQVDQWTSGGFHRRLDPLCKYWTKTDHCLLRRRA